jgi:hypothetical protein
MAIKPRKATLDVLAHVSTLRHIRNLLKTAYAAAETLQDVDKQTAEGIKEIRQNISKATSATENELNRFPLKGE